MKRSPPIRSIFERRTDFHRDLPMGDFACVEMGAGFHHLQPAEIFIGEGSLRYRIGYGILNAHGGGTDQFDFLVDVCTHKGTIALCWARVQYGLERYDLDLATIFTSSWVRIV